MTEDLEYLLAEARKFRENNKFDEHEQADQVRSFAYGNTHLENDGITMADIDEAASQLRSERGSTDFSICS